MRVRSLIATAAVVTSLTACANSAGETSAPAAATADGLISTDACTDPAAATAPITDTIRIGWTAALSGTFAASVRQSFDGMQARIDTENARGGIDGVMIELLERDDAFQPARAKANVTELIQREGVDIIGVAGAGQLGAVIDDQNAACVPALMTGTSAAQFRDVTTYPWTTQSLPAGTGEATFQAGYIAETFPDARVGVLENQTESGKASSAAFQAAAEAAGVEVVTTVPLGDDKIVALTSLQEAGADVYLVAGVVTDCLAVSEALGRVSYQPRLVVQASTCADADLIFKPAGAVADGQIVGSYMRLPADPVQSAEPAVQEYLAAAAAAGLESPTSAYAVDGWIKADVTIAAIRAAAEGPHGLSRASIMTAALNQDYAPPMYLDGIRFVSTPERFTGTTALQALRWDAAAQAFEPVGTPIAIG